MASQRDPIAEVGAIVKRNDALSRAVEFATPTVPFMPAVESSAVELPPVPVKLVASVPAVSAMDHPGGWMSLRDVATELAVSVRTVRRWVENDGFPQPVPFGGSLRVARVEFDAYVARKVAQSKRKSA